MMIVLHDILLVAALSIFRKEMVIEMKKTDLGECIPVTELHLYSIDLIYISEIVHRNSSSLYVHHRTGYKRDGLRFDRPLVNYLTKPVAAVE